jgi:hypothetical protein
VDLGFDPANIVVFDLQFSDPRYRSPGATFEFVNQLADDIDALGLGWQASYASGLPPRVGGFAIDVRPEVEGAGVVTETAMTIPRSSVAADLFQTMGIPLLEGRAFNNDEPEVVIVSDRMARRFWGSASPVGRRVRMAPTQPWLTVVGVAQDVKSMGLDDTVGDGMEWYFPYNPKQQPGSFAFVVRAPTSAATTIEHVRGRIRQMDPKLPITISTMDARVAASVWRPRFFLRLVIAFGIAGALLATVGVYATSASWASQRMRDFALRLALGATGREVAALVLPLGPGKVIVTLLCDFGQRYQSKLFNPDFLRSKDLPVPDWL